MGSRTEQVTIYVTEERKTELEQRADDADDSVSGVINDMIARQLQQDAQDAIASETRAEERLQELITVGTEEMTAAAEEIRDMNAKFGAYAIANFELMKRERSDHVRKQALTTGARRIRQDLDVVAADLAVEDASARDGDLESDSVAADEGATAESARRDAGASATETEDDEAVEMAAADAMTGGDTDGSNAGDGAESDDGGEPGLFDRLRGDDA